MSNRANKVLDNVFIYSPGIVIESAPFGRPHGGDGGMVPRIVAFFGPVDALRKQFSHFFAPIRVGCVLLEGASGKKKNPHGLKNM